VSSSVGQESNLESAKVFSDHQLADPRTAGSSAPVFSPDCTTQSGFSLFASRRLENSLERAQPAQATPRPAFQIAL